MKKNINIALKWYGFGMKWWYGFRVKQTVTTLTEPLFASVQWFKKG